MSHGFIAATPIYPVEVRAAESEAAREVRNSVRRALTDAALRAVTRAARLDEGVGVGGGEGGGERAFDEITSGETMSVEETLTESAFFWQVRPWFGLGAGLGWASVGPSDM